MDLGTIRKKLEKKEYKFESEVRGDLELVWKNCKDYNQPGSEIYKAAERMEKHYKQLLATLPASGQLRKRVPTEESKEGTDQSFGIKGQIFKRLKELDMPNLRGLIQEMIIKHPSCIKEVSAYEGR